MRPRTTITLVLLLLGALTAQTSMAIGKPARQDAPTSVQRDHVTRELSPQELNRVLDDHRKWLKAHHRNYKSQEALSDRRRADLRGTNLCGASLKGVKLWGATLTGANLSRADLAEAGLQDADLTRVNLFKANLRGASLSTANLTGADLSNAQLSGAVIAEANLMGAYLDRANLTGVNLRRANLSGASLAMADLTGSTLLGASMIGTFFTNANLTRANLSNANLTNATLTGANLIQAIFEPKFLPDADEIAYARNLSEMRWLASPQAMVILRKAFRDAGYRQQERELTYAIEHSQAVSHFRMAIDSKNVPAMLEGAFRYVFFEVTTKWGMAPGRALWLLIALVPVFAVPYVVALHRPGAKGIWRAWPTDRIRTDFETQGPERLHVDWLLAFRLGLYFSVLSAFNIGWRELNVGNWIQRLQPNEYVLRPTGWVRTLSGVQALISVFLLAMWALTYFGRPFE